MDTSDKIQIGRMIDNSINHHERATKQSEPTLRDQFAMAYNSKDIEKYPRYTAVSAYKMADAMLKAREATND